MAYIAVLEVAQAPEAIAKRVHKEALCRVKLEVDIDPPPGAQFEVRYIDDPGFLRINAWI